MEIHRRRMTKCFFCFPRRRREAARCLELFFRRGLFGSARQSLNNSQAQAAAQERTVALSVFLRAGKFSRGARAREREREEEKKALEEETRRRRKRRGEKKKKESRRLPRGFRRERLFRLAFRLSPLRFLFSLLKRNRAAGRGSERSVRGKQH